MNQVEIRPMVIADVGVLAEALIAVHALDGYPVEGVSDPRAWLAPSGALGQWTALLDGKPVGHVAVTRPTSTDTAPAMLAERERISLAEVAVLARLFILPSARRQSLASKLVETAEKAASALGLRLTLDVMEKDQKAISLYLRRGWVELGNFRHAHDDTSVPAIAMVAPTQSEA